MQQTILRQLILTITKKTHAQTISVKLLKTETPSNRLLDHETHEKQF